MTAGSSLKLLVSAGFSLGTFRESDTEGMAMSFLQRLQEKGAILEIVAVGIGGACAEKAVLAALARGADRAILVEAPEVDPRAASVFLAGVAKREKPDLIVTEHSPVDDPTSQVAPRLAAILGWPYASGVLKIEIARGGRRCEVVREMDGMRERLDLSLPAVLSVSVSINTIPLLSLYEIVAARNKPIERTKGAHLSKIPTTGIAVLQSEPAVIHRKGRLVENVDELIKALREEEHLI